MGAVYLARELRLDRAVAIKVLPPDLAIDDRYRQRFLREARTVAALMHPNIVPIHAVDEAAEWVYFVMGYVAGETLAQRVARCGPLSPGDGARLLREIGEALAYAHACGVVHRDVKPDNILLDTATGRALLSDFGIAHVSGDGRPAPVAPRGPVLGTAAFMSPEQARGEPVDARSDLYSLGVVGFYALSGRLPFNAVTETALLALHIAEPAPPLAAVAPPPGVPPRLAQVVDRCLEKDPWARFVDAGALVRAVSDAMEPPPAPLAVRAFLVRGAYLAGPARLHAALTGLVLVPAAVATWLEALDPALRAAASAALGVAILVPAWVAIARVRRLIAAGHRREDLVAALATAQARRLEELAIAYGAEPSSFDRGVHWLARTALLVAAAAVWVLSTGALIQVGDLIPRVAAGAAGVALLAAIAARARTEQRTEPRGQRRLRLWRSPLGRLVFRLAAIGLRRRPAIVTILGRLETPA